MRILFVINKDAGLYNGRNELLHILVKDHKVFFTCPKGEFIEDIKKIGCEYIPHEFNRLSKNPCSDLKLLIFYKKLLDKLKPDIVFTYTIKPNVYMGIAAASKRIPCVANITGLGRAVEDGGLLQKLVLMLYRKGLKKDQMVFFQNNANRKFMVERRIIKNIPHAVLPGSGVNLDKFKKMDYPKDYFFNFVFVGRLTKEKGIDNYLDAAETVHKEYPNTVFHICGYPEDNWTNMDRVNTLENLGVVKFHGRLADMREMYKQCCCVVHPSYYPEGMSNVLLEACAIGRPIITTDRPGCGEILRNGLNGFMVRKDDSKDLATQIKKFLSLDISEKEKMGDIGRKIVEEEFDRNIVINAYLSEIEKIKKKNC